MRRPLRDTAGLVAACLLLAGCPEDPPQEPEPTPTEEPTPTPPDDEAEEGAWEELPDAPIASRLNHSATWADGLVIVWGGQDRESFEMAADGAAWDPRTGEWQAVPEAPVEARWAHHAMWTGDELIVWGGTAGPDHLATCYTDGARYDPRSRDWQAIPDAPGPSRCGAQVVWTGDELVAFGGHRGDGPPGPQDRHDDGVAYNPAAGEWRTLPSAPIAPRAGGLAVWTGTELVVYGGHTQADDVDGFDYLADGAAYDPDTDEWRQIADSPLPPLRGIGGLAVGEELMVFGGQEPGVEGDERSTAVAAYDPRADDWRTLADLPGPQDTAEAVWTGDVVYVLGGGLPEPPPGEDPPDEEAAPPFMAYVAEEDRWLERPDPPGGPRRNHALAWTGAELIVWGGQAAGDAAAGLRWDSPG